MHLHTAMQIYTITQSSIHYVFSLIFTFISLNKLVFSNYLTQQFCTCVACKYWYCAYFTKNELSNILDSNILDWLYYTLYTGV